MFQMQSKKKQKTQKLKQKKAKAYYVKVNLVFNAKQNRKALSNLIII